MAKDHFVPRHYLRQFAIKGTEEIVVARITPRRYIGPKGIGGECQEDDFYEGDTNLGKLLWQIENDIAPVLVRVVKNESFTQPELVGLRWLAVNLHFRTRKAAEAFSVLPKRIFYEFVQSATAHGQIPPPPDGKWTEDMVDCKGTSAFLIKTASISCSLEMQTLACKILKTESGAFFIASDNPVVLFNQFCANNEPHRRCVGFTKAGFQLLLPISPSLCLFFYDAKVYKVGSPRHRLIHVSKGDVELLNALQIQSAEESVYCHDTNLQGEVQSLIARYEGLRTPVKDMLRTVASNANEELFYFGAPLMKLPKGWNFSRLRKKIKSQIGDRRDPAWTALIDELMEDCEKNLNAGDIPTRINRILADPNSLKNICLR